MAYSVAYHLPDAPCGLVQERLTKEIAEAVLNAVHPTGVGVVIEAT